MPSRKKLPPIFQKVRFQLGTDLTPPVVIHVPDTTALTSTEELKEQAYQIGDGNIPIETFDFWWLEVKYCAFMIAVTKDDEDRPVSRRVRVYVPDGSKADEYTYSIFDFDQIDNDTRKGDALVILQAENMIWQASQKEADVSVNTKTRNAPVAWHKAADTIRYARLDDLASVAGTTRQRDYTPPDEPSGIRKCEHQVRGHWRTYRSGVRVWVKAHKRGDPELGTTTRVIGI